MIFEYKKLAIVTPLKNEFNGIKRFLKSIKNQSMPIEFLLIIENDSTDRSDIYLKKIKQLKNVKNFDVINLNMEDKSYKLGKKYSSIVKYGFDYLKCKNHSLYNKLDCIGILDADCYPEKFYYEKLIEELFSDESLGLVGGVLCLDNGLIESKSDSHIRGSGRVWKLKAFEDSDYKVSISADANSLIKTKLAGWSVKQIKHAKFYSRETSIRVGLAYSGKSAYYNGFSKTFVFFKFLRYLTTHPSYSIQFIRGYLNSFFKDLETNEDEIIINYNKHRLRNKLKEKFFK